VITSKNSRNRTFLNISKIACLLLLIVLCSAIFIPNVFSHQPSDNTYNGNILSNATSKDSLKINLISKSSNTFEEELEVVVGQNTSAIITFRFQGLNFSISGIDISSEPFQHVKYMHLVFTCFSKDYSLYWPKPIWEYPEGVTLVLCFKETTFENALSYAYSIYRDFSQAFGLDEMNLINFVNLDGGYAFMFNKFLNISISAQYARQILTSVLPDDGLASLLDLNLMVNSLFYGFSIGFVESNGKLIGNVFVSWLNPSAVFSKGNEYVISVNYAVNHTGSIEPSSSSISSYVKIRFPYVVNVTEFFVEPLSGKYFGRTYIFDLLSLGSTVDIGLKYNFNILPQDIPIINAFVEITYSSQRGMGYGFRTNITVHLKSLGSSDAHNVTVLFSYSILEETFENITSHDFNRTGDKLMAYRRVLKHGEDSKFTFIVSRPRQGRYSFRVEDLDQSAVVIYKDKMGRKYVVYANSFGFDLPTGPFGFKLYPTIRIELSSSQIFLNQTQVVRVFLNRSDLPISNVKVSLYRGWIEPFSLEFKYEEQITTISISSSENLIEFPIGKMHLVGYYVVYGVLSYEREGEAFSVYSNVVPFVVFPKNVEAKYPYPLPVLKVSKDLKSKVNVGDQFWINVTVSNVGTENTTITLFETIPDAFKIINVNVSKGNVREERIEIGKRQYSVLIVDEVNLDVDEDFYLHIFVKVAHASVVNIPPTSCIATTSYEDFEVAYPSATEILQTNSITTYSQAHSIIVNVLKLLTYNKTLLLYLICFDTALLLFIIIKIRKEKTEPPLPI